MDIASVNSAAYFKLHGASIKEARLSIGGVAPVPLYLAKTSEFLTGKSLNYETFIEAGEIAASECAPISDVRGSETYKRLMAEKMPLIHFAALFPEKMVPEKLV